MPYKHNGHVIVRDTSKHGAEKLHGMRDTTIYVTYQAYLRQSYEFRRTCIERNIKVEIVT